MLFNQHSNLVGLHAFLSPSQSAWSNYDDEKLDLRYIAAQAAKKGVELHDFANHAIRLGIKLPSSTKTLNMYVNDGIGYRMAPEQVLFYSSNAFGTCDTISFRKNLLRIHDLKTGVSPCSMRQLEIYAAFFCLEYRVKPMEIEMELRIYKEDAKQIHIPDPDLITHLMDRIVTFDKRIEQLKKEV